jgi:long-chain fatty acid transport protein
MSSLLRFLSFVLVPFLCASSIASAGGFQLNEHGAKATGMAGAFVAQSNDGSAIYFNPAGLAFQPGTNILGGTILIAPSTTYTDPAKQNTKMNSQVFFPSNLYGTHALNDAVVVGIGVYNPFGLGVEWPSDWSGKYLAVKADIQSFFVNPSVGYKINDQLSVGVGVSYVYSSISLSNAVPTSSDPAGSIFNVVGSVKLAASGTGFNFNGGVLYKPLTELSLGVSYRHSTKVNFNGTATFSNMQGLANYFPGGDGSTTITLPSTLFAGVAYNVLPELTVEADYQGTGWSSYDKLSVTLKDGPPHPVRGVLQTSQVYQKDWDDTYLVRIGGEYRYNEFAFRAGYIFDKTPQPDKSLEPLLPDANRNDFTFGAGYKTSGNITIDVTYMVVLFNDHTVTSPVNLFAGYGTYKSSANLFGIDVGYSF